MKKMRQLHRMVLFILPSSYSACIYPGYENHFNKGKAANINNSACSRDYMSCPEQRLTWLHRRRSPPSIYMSKSPPPRLGTTLVSHPFLRSATGVRLARLNVNVATEQNSETKTAFMNQVSITSNHKWYLRVWGVYHSWPMEPHQGSSSMR